MALSGLLALAGACADDAAGAASAEGTGSSSDDGAETAVAETGGDDVLDESGDDDGTTGMVDETTDDGMVDSSDGPPPECFEDSDCDDNEPCTEDECKALGNCEHTPTETTTCRPSINLSTPGRGATIETPSGSTIEVAGDVTTGYGTITSLTLNGQDVTLGADGSFSTTFDPSIGGNTLILETTDSNGWSRRRVQSLLWSPNFREPFTPPPMYGSTSDGVRIWLDQETIDDGDRSAPIDDIASIMQVVLDGVDVTTLVDTNTPITSSQGYNIYITDIDVASRSVALSANDTGVHVNAILDDVVGDLFFDCTGTNPWDACVLAGGDGTGGFSIDSVDIDADLVVTVTASHQLNVTVSNVNTTVNTLDIWSNNIWTNFLITIIEPFIIGGIVSDLESMLTDTVSDMFGPLVEEGFSQLDLGTALQFPNMVDPTDPIIVNLDTDFASADFDDGSAPPSPPPPQGGLVVFRAGGYTPTMATPYNNLGIPDRMGCDEGQADPVLPLSAPVEIGLTDDMLNQLLFAGWRGGMLEFPLDIPDGSIAGATDVEVTVTGRLAPTVTDCNTTGDLIAHLGDLQINASMNVFDSPISFVAYTSMALQMSVDATNGGIEISFPAIEWIETELTVDQDNAIELEDFITMSVESALEEELLASLGAGGFSGISLPEIDLSAQLGQAPGTVVLSINVDDVDHAPGITVVSGHL